MITKTSASLLSLFTIAVLAPWAAHASLAPIKWEYKNCSEIQPNIVGAQPTEGKPDESELTIRVGAQTESREIQWRTGLFQGMDRDSFGKITASSPSWKFFVSGPEVQKSGGWLSSIVHLHRKPVSYRSSWSAVSYPLAPKWDDATTRDFGYSPALLMYTETEFRNPNDGGMARTIAVAQSFVSADNRPKYSLAKYSSTGMVRYYVDTNVKGELWAKVIRICGDGFGKEVSSKPYRFKLEGKETERGILDSFQLESDPGVTKSEVPAEVPQK